MRIQDMINFEPVPWALLPDLGLYMDQVVTYIERQFSPLYGKDVKGIITPSMINNYVKSRLLPRPTGKKYSREHLAQLMMIVTLKPVMSMETIAKLITPREGEAMDALYEAFRQTLCQIFSDVATAAQPHALRLAVTATAYRLAAESLLDTGDEPIKLSAPAPEAEH